MAVRKTQWLVPYIAHFLKRSALVTTTCFKSPLEKVGKCCFVDFSEWERVAELVYEVVAYETFNCTHTVNSKDLFHGPKLPKLVLMPLGLIRSFALQLVYSRCCATWAQIISNTAQFLPFLHKTTVISKLLGELNCSFD